MAARFAAGEVLVSATEDDCFSQFSSENRVGTDGAICNYREKSNFSTEGFEDFGALMHGRSHSRTRMLQH